MLLLRFFVFASLMVWLSRHYVQVFPMLVEYHKMLVYYKNKSKLYNNVPAEE